MEGDWMKTIISGLEVVRLALKSMKRWRWRYITLAVLIAASFTIFTLYASLLTVSSHRSIAKIEALQLPTDFVVVASGTRLNRSSTDRFQPTKGGRASLTFGEEAVMLVADTTLGTTKMLGAGPDSRFFSAEAIQIVSGQPLKNEMDIVLPQSWAEHGFTLGSSVWLGISNPSTGSLRQMTFSVTGFYARVDDLTMPLIRMEDAALVRGATGANCYLAQMSSGADLQQTLAWVRLLFPGDRVLSSVAAQELGQGLASQTNQPGWGLLLLVNVFVGVAVLTITAMTFLERRRELAVLKTLGTANSQVALMLRIELIGSAGGGLLAGLVVSLLLGAKMPWMAEISAGALTVIQIGGAALSLLVVAMAALLPVVMAKVATVNELLFARMIPLSRQLVQQVEHTYSWVVAREQQEGVRLLRLDVIDGRFDGILMRSKGDRVKHGEVIASLDTVFGLVRKQWASPADGLITDYDPVSGYVVIKPDQSLAAVSLQVQTFRAGPAVGLGVPRIAPRMVMVQATAQDDRARQEPAENRTPRPWWRRPWAIAALIGAVMIPTATFILRYYRPQGLPITSYRPPNPSYPSYQRWSKDLADLAASYPDLVTLTEIGRTYGGQPILALTITDRISGDEQSKPGAFLMAGQHADEALSSQVALSAIKQLLSDHGQNAAATSLLRQKVIYAVPVVNPDGYGVFSSKTTTVHGNARPLVDSDRDGRLDEDPSIMPAGAWLRSHVVFAQDWLLQHPDDPFAPGWQEYQREVGENYTHVYCPDGKRYAQVDQDGDGSITEDGYDGVDLNRNWGTNFRIIENYGDGYFGGIEAWSEAETRAVRDFVLAHPNITQALDLHTGDEQILFPLAFSAAKVPEYEQYMEIGTRLRPDEAIEVQPYSKLRPHSGTAIDWLYQQKIMPLVFELYQGRPKYQLQSDGSYVYYMNPSWIYNTVNNDDYNRVVRRWVPSILDWMSMDLKSVR